MTQLIKETFCVRGLTLRVVAREQRIEFVRGYLPLARVYIYSFRTASEDSGNCRVVSEGFPVVLLGRILPSHSGFTPLHFAGLP